MFNRHTYEKYEHILESEERKDRENALMMAKRKSLSCFK